MHLTLFSYHLSFSEKMLSGELIFPADKALQILELRVLQRIQRQYCIGKKEIISAIGEGSLTFTIPIKPRLLSSQLMDKKLKQMKELIHEEASLYELQVQYIQGNGNGICLFPLLIGS